MRLKHLLALLGIAVFMAACGPDTKTDPNADATSRLGRPDPRGSWRDFTNPGRNGYADRVFFDLDQYSIRPDQEATVRAWAEWLRAHPGATLLVEGHCDERGTREYNLGLGARRATSVKNMMVSLGVEANRVRTISYGKERPAEAGSTEEAWSRNRRGVAVPSGPGA
ncbi:MAG: peptidoglycan-associated lipoprotein Pal [Rhodospirillaceae bacterium]|nr:peptidoglycan-associated lipoprotein Pal [Rhodospirillaceae bacterium]